ncbi:MAG: hypothetical protein U5K37_00650 [Natrialbaceae archaeon]|nr:hypothetical protein [Natrialbaceae archaeon]
MELSPEEYSAYWRGSIRIAAGILVVAVGYQVAAPLLGHDAPAANVLGIALLVGLVLAGSYIATLGIARTVRVAVDAEMRG